MMTVPSKVSQGESSEDFNYMIGAFLMKLSPLV
jgi:hypothetical protein